MNPIAAAALAFFSVVGLADTLYLSYHAWFKKEVACWWFPKEWCRKVQHSSFSKTLGIPNPYLGLAMYASILVLVYLAASGSVSQLPLRAVVSFGFVFSLYFTAIQAFVLRAFCTWCVVSAVNFTVMFLALWV